LTCDVTVEEQLVAAVGRAADHFGRIDILINNAGQGYDAMIEETDVALFRRLFDLYLAAPLVAMKQVIPLMRRQGGGAIVNVSSGTALMHMPGMGAYSAVKAALAHLSLTARQELKEDGIAVTVVYPWVTLTEFERRTIKAHGETGEEESFEHLPHPPDTAEFLAGKIVEARESGVAEVHPHDWMLKLS
jgi:NAD(P)-dependent dehydrogenase (short-subunit alcohol dehydrogenase family)